MISSDVPHSHSTDLSTMLSPCVKICIINPQTRLCEGCGRTIEEIASWSTYSREERQVIMSKLIDRKRSSRKE